ncbi:MAG: hypothetical protein ACPGJS_15470 [Flammeovirgaceae bacterium]
MSRNYAYRLIVDRENTKLLLTNTFARCTTFSTNTLEFPNGETMEGPFSGGISVGKRHRFSGRIANITLPVAMTFETDEYLHKTNFAQGQQTTIELIHIEIFLGNKYTFVNYKASNSKISRLFEHSTSIKSSFQTLAEDSKCLLSFFDKQEATCYLLDDLNTPIPCNQQYKPNPIFEKPDRLDFYAESFLENALSS